MSECICVTVCVSVCVYVLRAASSSHDHGGSQEDSSFSQSLALTQSTDISDLIERYSKVTRATTASGSMGVGLFNPREKVCTQ